MSSSSRSARAVASAVSRNPLEKKLSSNGVAFSRSYFSSVNIKHKRFERQNNTLFNSNAFSENYRRGAVRTVFVMAEATPNPESQIFYPQDKDVLGPRTRTQSFSDKYSAKSSLLATALFKIHGVNTVLLGAQHITVTKDPDVDWDFLRPNVELVISQFFAAGIEPVDKSSIEYIEEAEEGTQTSYADGDLDEGIIKLLRDRVQPFVQQDGGDVEYVKTENNVVWLKMMGACAGCPKSNITLHMQIKQLIQHYFPEIVDVAEYVDVNAEEIPRPR